MKDSLHTSMSDEHSLRHGIIQLKGHGLLIPAGRSFYIEKWPLEEPEMAYDKPGIKEVGVALYNLVDGLSNGVGTDEIANLTKLLIEASQVTDSLKSDPDAAGLHIIAVLADLYGDKRVNPFPWSKLQSP